MNRNPVWASALLVAFAIPLAGCNTRMPVRLDVEGKKRAQAEAKIGRHDQAVESFHAYLDEVLKATELLQTFPSPETMADEVAKLKDLAGKASDLAPGTDFMQDCRNETQNILKFFTVSLANIRNFESRPDKTDVSREKVKAVLISNAMTARKAVERFREELRKRGG